MVKNSSAMQKTCRRHRFDPWVKNILWRRKWQPTLVLLPGKSHGQRILVGYSSWGCKDADMTEQLNTHTYTTHTHTPTHTRRTHTPTHTRRTHTTHTHTHTHPHTHTNTPRIHLKGHRSCVFQYMWQLNSISFSVQSVSFISLLVFENTVDSCKQIFSDPIL